MADRKNWTVIAAAVAGVAVVGAGLYLLLRAPADEPEEAPASSSKPPKAESAPKSKSAPAAAAAPAAASGSSGRAAASTGPVTKEKLAQILRVMIAKLAELQETSKSKMETLVAQGMNPGEASQMVDMQKMEAFQSIEAHIGESFNIDQFALMDAQAKYQNDPDISELMSNVRMHFFGEEQMAEIAEASKLAPPDMTPDRFAGVITKHIQMLEGAFSKALGDAKEVTGGATYEEKLQYLEYIMSQRMEDIQEKALRTVGLTEDEFKGCMIKFGNERKIVELIMESQMRQEQLKEKFFGPAPG